MGSWVEALEWFVIECAMLALCWFRADGEVGEVYRGLYALCKSLGIVIIPSLHEAGVVQVASRRIIEKGVENE